MKQVLQNYKTGKLELVDIPIPALKPGFVLVKNYYSLISPGTEKAGIELAKKNILEKAKSRPDLVRQVFGKMKTEGVFTTFKKVMGKLDKPLPMGYSSAGRIIEIGRNVEEFEIGDEVACAGAGYASHAEVIAVPKNLCLKIPENVSLKAAAFTTLGAIAMQGIRRANLTPGEKIAVIGLGLVGQLTCQILKAYGFPVLGFDINPLAIKRASNQGIDDAGMLNKAEGLVKSFTNGKGVDTVIITAATKSSAPIELAGKILRDRGRVSVVGDVGIDIPRRTYYKKELDVVISRSYGPGRYDKNYEEKGRDYPFGYVRWTEKRNMEEFLRLVAQDKVQPEKLITHTFDIEQAQEAYKLIFENLNKEEIIGVLFSYNTEKEQTDTVFFKTEKEYKKKDKINIGLIGVGNFAQGTVLPALKKIKNVQLWATADAQGINAQRIIKQFDGTYATTNWQKIVRDKDIDLIIVTTRHNLHSKIAIEALRQNKNVHIEKPLCLNEKELEEIIKVARNSRGRIMVGFNRRFAPLTLKAKEIFTDNSPLMIYYRVNAGFVPKEHWVHNPVEGGGRIIGEVCHFVDFCQFLTNSEPKRVYASMTPLGGSITTEDNLIVNLDFKNGSRAAILYTSLGSTNFPKEYLEIFGNGKVMTINNFKAAEIYTKRGKKKIWKASQDKGHFNELKALVESVQQGKPSPIPFKEIILVTQTTFNIIKSIKENEIIETK